MHQRCLLPPESIAPRTRYEMLFENLPEIPSQRTRRGRPPVSRDPLLKALIYRNLRGINKLVELEFELRNNRSIAEPLGFDPFWTPPSDERFSEFLRSHPNGYFQGIRNRYYMSSSPNGSFSAMALNAAEPDATLLTAYYRSCRGCQLRCRGNPRIHYRADES